MIPFISELQLLSGLYHRLKSEILDPACQTVEKGALPQPELLLDKRELLLRIEQMTARAAELADEWERFRAALDPGSRADIRALAADVRNQGEELSQLCRELSAGLEAKRAALERELAQIRTGARYLSSVRPPSTNYPKFVDSLG